MEISFLYQNLMQRPVQARIWPLKTSHGPYNNNLGTVCNTADPIFWFGRCTCRFGRFTCRSPKISNLMTLILVPKTPYSKILR